MNINPVHVVERGVLLVPEGGIPIVTDFADKECQIQSNGVDLRLKDGVCLMARACKNVELYEHFCMINCFGAIWIRSSFSRRGVFCSSGLFDVSFGVGVPGGSIGGITLYNMSEDTVVIPSMTRICQMVFFSALPEHVGKPYDGYYNKNQTIHSQLVSK
jgi:deoxycytidine triphosphate deaminase